LQILDFRFRISAGINWNVNQSFESGAQRAPKDLSVQREARGMKPKSNPKSEI